MVDDEFSRASEHEEDDFETRPIRSFLKSEASVDQNAVKIPETDEIRWYLIIQFQAVEKKYYDQPLSWPQVDNIRSSFGEMVFLQHPEHSSKNGTTTFLAYCNDRGTALLWMDPTQWIFFEKVFKKCYRVTLVTFTTVTRNVTEALEDYYNKNTLK